MSGEPSTGRVSISLAREDQRLLIENLFQFYVYDFSELEPPGSPGFEFNADGLFDPYPYMADYWREAGRRPLLIHVGDNVAGFALINTYSHHGGEVENNVAEFFVARKHRRAGVGAEAVRQIVALYPGRWEAAVVARNLAAQAFWPRAIASAPNVSDIERREGDGVQWRGPIWSFNAA
ncbi:MAG TPA: GNAT family N-acetyltransferase [Phenylobacterium sp.]|nr:GNAT family N-acetyltransferase [Phenylobacterium sp.]